MTHYKNDPRTIIVRYPCACKNCGKKLTKGSNAFYWPASHAVLCQVCGEPEYRRFIESAQDEDFYNSY
jgi:RNase P subunit RPR2